MAAALWILNYGVVIHTASLYPEHDIAEDFNHGPKYQVLVEAGSKGGFKTLLQRLRTAVPGRSSDASERQRKRFLTPHRWSFWKQRLH